MSKCFGKEHDLEVISTQYGGATGVSYVTRWCNGCGGIVVDVDVDGRTQPGGVMPMKFPAVTKEVAKQLRVNR